MGIKKVWDGIFLVGGQKISDMRDCSVYLIDFEGELVFIDSGAGPGMEKILHNVKKLGFDPKKISTVILTHCHIDHAGGARRLKSEFGARIFIHERDAKAVEAGDVIRTAASWYNLGFPPLSVDYKMTGKEEKLYFAGQELFCLHTPGHTPGSISLYLERNGKKVLFGQDIHGPFRTEFGSNLIDWQVSMEMLLALEADILCEGHFGVYEPKNMVREYIERYLDEYG